LNKKLNFIFYLDVAVELEQELAVELEQELAVVLEQGLAVVLALKTNYKN
jgi:hypothetical protein